MHYMHQVLVQDTNHTRKLSPPAVRCVARTGTDCCVLAGAMPAAAVLPAEASPPVTAAETLLSAKRAPINWAYGLAWPGGLQPDQACLCTCYRVLVSWLMQRHAMRQPDTAKVSASCGTMQQVDERYMPFRSNALLADAVVHLSQCSEPCAVYVRKTCPPPPPVSPAPAPTLPPAPSLRRLHLNPAACRTTTSHHH